MPIFAHHDAKTLPWYSYAARASTLAQTKHDALVASAYHRELSCAIAIIKTRERGCHWWDPRVDTKAINSYLNPWRTEFFLGNHQTIFAFFTIVWHCDCTVSSNSLTSLIFCYCLVFVVLIKRPIIIRENYMSTLSNQLIFTWPE